MIDRFYLESRPVYEDFPSWLLSSGPYSLNLRTDHLRATKEGLLYKKPQTESITWETLNSLSFFLLAAHVLDVLVVLVNLGTASSRKLSQSFHYYWTQVIMELVPVWLMIITGSQQIVFTADPSWATWDWKCVTMCVRKLVWKGYFFLGNCMVLCVHKMGGKLWKIHPKWVIFWNNVNKIICLKKLHTKLVVCGIITKKLNQFTKDRA